jgi:hypothetical protein
VGVVVAACALFWLSCPAPAVPCDTGAIGRAFAEGQSDVWVEGCGTVVRVLPDDREGSRHQRFILELESGQTLLFAHNVDLAPRAPIDVGTAVRFRGTYEWNDKGGVVHWTHHDPRGNHAGGWLEVEGRRFR